MSKTHTYVKFVVPLIVATAFAVAGYFVFLGFMNDSQSLVNVFPLAVIAGVASFFSPCAFPLLPGIIAIDVNEKNKLSPSVKGLVSATGVLSFLLPLGIIIALVGVPLGSLLQDNLRNIRGVIGILLLYLSYMQLSGGHFNFLEKHAPRGGENSKSSYRLPFSFGFGYVMVGSGCTVPILAGLTVSALATGGFIAAFLSFAVAGSVMALLMFSFMTYAGTVKVLPEHMTKLTPKIKKISGIVLLVIGMFYIANALFVWI